MSKSVLVIDTPKNCHGMPSSYSAYDRGKANVHGD